MTIRPVIAIAPRRASACGLVHLIGRVRSIFMAGSIGIGPVQLWVEQV